MLAFVAGASYLCSLLAPAHLRTFELHVRTHKCENTAAANRHEIIAEARQEISKQAATNEGLTAREAALRSTLRHQEEAFEAREHRGAAETEAFAAEHAALPSDDVRELQ